MDNDATLFVRSRINDHCHGVDDKFSESVWLAHRMRIYLTYTVPSLLRQTIDNFKIWLDCREKSESEIEPYMQALDEAGVLVTFDRGCSTSKSICGEPAYITRIDSDDMYAPTALKMIRNYHGEQLASLFVRGFIWYVDAQLLQALSHQSPPFYTFRVKATADGFEEPPIETHKDVMANYDPTVLSDRMFCMLRHGKHLARQPIAGGGLYIKRAGYRATIVKRFQLEDPLTFWEEQRAKEVLKVLHVKDYKTDA